MPELIAAICRRCGQPFFFDLNRQPQSHCDRCKQRAGVGRPPKAKGNVAVGGEVGRPVTYTSCTGIARNGNRGK